MNIRIAHSHVNKKVRLFSNQYFRLRIRTVYTAEHFEKCRTVLLRHRQATNPSEQNRKPQLLFFDSHDCCKWNQIAW